MAESHMNMDSDDRSFWEAATDDGAMIARLKRIGLTPFKVRGDVQWFKVPTEQVLLRNMPTKRVLTDEQKEKLAAQLARGRATQAKGTVSED